MGTVKSDNVFICKLLLTAWSARLLTHVDREATHAASLIINIAQGAIRKPWKVEIYDFSDRLHEVEMEPGLECT